MFADWVTIFAEHKVLLQKRINFHSTAAPTRSHDIKAPSPASEPSPLQPRAGAAPSAADNRTLEGTSPKTEFLPSELICFVFKRNQASWGQPQNTSCYSLHQSMTSFRHSWQIWASQSLCLQSQPHQLHHSSIKSMDEGFHPSKHFVLTSSSATVQKKGFLELEEELGCLAAVPQKPAVNLFLAAFLEEWNKN